MAVQFLTRVPVGQAPTTGPDGDHDLTTASAWFPLVGLLVAAVGIAVRAGLEPLLGRAPATVAAVLATVLVTGAFHEDGLADSADGLWGGADPARRLAIMHDSRLGTYGTYALVGDLALRVALLAPLTLVDLARAMLAAQVIGRLAPLVLVAWLPPAAPDGQGVRMRRRLGAAGWVTAAGSVAVAAVATVGPYAPALLAAAGLGVWLVGRTARSRLGGVTGDLLGAGVRVSGLLVAATVVALARAEVW